MNAHKTHCNQGEYLGSWRGEVSNYTIGVDMASGSDSSAVVICRQRSIRWYHRLLKKLHIRKHLAKIEIVDCYNVEPTDIKRKERG